MEPLVPVTLVALAIVIGLELVLLLRRGARGATAQLEAGMRQLAAGQERLERCLRDEGNRGRREAAEQAGQLRQEVLSSVTGLNDSLVGSVVQLGQLQQGQLDSFASQLALVGQASEQRLTELRNTVDGRLRHIQEDNNQRLEQMRQTVDGRLDEMRRTVDERLETTLEKRLGESFQLVSERLEAVHRGLGEMQSLAAGVGDLKRVLTNVKTRGTWGEVQLGSLLEQILTPEQYQANVCCQAGSAERVEYALKLPGRDAVGDAVWLPLDAKFPLEDYQRLLEAQEAGDLPAVEAASRQLELRVKASAKEIRQKYVHPPATTDFGILFLPTEGLYAEVLRRPGLAEALQRDFRVVVAGPTTLAALLNSLQMGFRTLAIEQRSSEVWQLLGAVKTQFAQFGETLEKVQTKLHQASSSIEKAASKSRTIERQLRTVETLPPESARELLLDSAAPAPYQPEEKEQDDGAQEGHDEAPDVEAGNPLEPEELHH